MLEQDKSIEQVTVSLPEYNYVVLMETSGEECESWYYCLRYEGNEDNLKVLSEQLESVDWYIFVNCIR